MAHRLPPAGTKTVESEHFAFCQVLPKSKPKGNGNCTQRIGGCLLRPKFVALPVRTPGPRPNRFDNECVQITCRCEETDESREPQCSQFRSGRQCHDMIVINSPGQGDQRPADEPSCRIPNMRRREVSVREPDTCDSPMVLEFVDDPFMVADTSDCGKDSMAVNVGSQDHCYSMAGPPGRDRQLIPVISRKCIPQVLDFRRRRSITK